MHHGCSGRRRPRLWGPAAVCAGARQPAGPGCFACPWAAARPRDRHTRACGSARRLEARPGPATTHGHRSQALLPLLRLHTSSQTVQNSPRTVSSSPKRYKTRPAGAKSTKTGLFLGVGRILSRLCRRRPPVGRVLSRKLAQGFPSGASHLMIDHERPLPDKALLTSTRTHNEWRSSPHTRGENKHEKSTPEGVLGRNAEPPPVDRTEGGRCAPGGTRTPNLLNRNQMLYPLSYGRFAVWLGISLHALHQDAKSRVMT